MFPALKSIKLKILVFGPDPTASHPPGFLADLSRKRADIRNALVADGHAAAFPEDLWKGISDPAINNTYIWEMSLVREYDLIISLVGCYGAIDELSLFHKPELAWKAALFFNNDHIGGLSYSHAQALERIGATLHTYIYPTDLTGCHLLTKVQAKVENVLTAKYFIS